MTNHLSEDALLEIVEAGKSHPHLAECDRCRRLFEDVHDALALARGDEMREPSPLFWDHFSVRVRAAVEHGATVGSSSAFRWFLEPAWRPVAIVAVFAVVVAAATWRLWPAGDSSREVASSTRPTATQPTSDLVVTADAQPVADLLVPAADPSWLVIAQVTAHVEIANVADAGLMLQPDATDRAISQLTPSEQQELVRLLQSDPDGPSQ